MRHVLLAVVLLAPLVAAGDEPAGRAPAASEQPHEQSQTPMPAPDNTSTGHEPSVEPFVPSEKVSADTAVAFPVDI